MFLLHTLLARKTRISYAFITAIALLPWTTRKLWFFHRSGQNHFTLRFQVPQSETHLKHLLYGSWSHDAKCGPVLPFSNSVFQCWMLHRTRLLVSYPTNICHSSERTQTMPYSVAGWHAEEGNNLHGTWTKVRLQKEAKWLFLKKSVSWAAWMLLVLLFTMQNRKYSASRFALDRWSVRTEQPLPLINSSH